MSAFRTVRVPSWIEGLPHLETEFSILPEEAGDRICMMVSTGCSTACIRMTPTEVSALVDALASGLREFDPPHKDDDRMYGALSDLAGIDVHDMNLRDHPKAYEVLNRLMTHAYGDGRKDEAEQISTLQEEMLACLESVLADDDAHLEKLKSLFEPDESGEFEPSARTERIRALVQRVKGTP